MSDLKHQTVEQLRKSKIQTEERIEHYQGKIHSHNSTIRGQLTRLEWINKYLHEKTPVELTMAQIEQRLGHKVIIK